RLLAGDLADLRDGGVAACAAIVGLRAAAAGAVAQPPVDGAPVVGAGHGPGGGADAPVAVGADRSPAARIRARGAGGGAATVDRLAPACAEERPAARRDHHRIASGTTARRRGVDRDDLCAARVGAIGDGLDPVP